MAPLAHRVGMAAQHGDWAADRVALAADTVVLAADRAALAVDMVAPVEGKVVLVAGKSVAQVVDTPEPDHHPAIDRTTPLGFGALS